ncbi:hypothetical protein PY254_02535 [Rhodanobacter sp. AS-Z3]|uniref:hypothetical protein n=1 Tax=Rhodanobacter sp. AS-Z3 TaxID=3031330 RepID=UPI00247A81ED|nr:hypothetical protein [Rhodanobacter sp. AS-Z3]WEN15572.1 hypothetical protein PY254_02535 [Rhodanobacter sp. AS-Z3]
MPICHAQSAVTPEHEYKKLIRVSEDIQPLGQNPFGESVSLYNGNLSFEQTDVSLAGNGPMLQLSRSFQPKDSSEAGAVDGGFADWNVELPRITTMASSFWRVSGPSPRSRCSQFGPPPVIAGTQGSADWDPVTWWNGYQLVVPGQGSQDLLKRAPKNTLSPTMGGTVFPIVTTHNWMISCGVASDDQTSDPGGEGFMAVAPDGTRYWFTHLVYRWAPSMNRSISSGPQGLRSMGVHPNVAVDGFLIRRQASMLVSRIEDRFGNSLTYSYSGAQLTAITASDGRQLSVSYVSGTDRIGSVSVVPASGPARTWNYQYNTALLPLLTQVTLPDGSHWSYNLGGLRAGTIVEGQGDCDTAASVSTNTPSGSMVHPSGLTGSFQIKPVVRGRSYVARQCKMTADGSSYASIPRVYYAFALSQKTFSGAGLPSQTWNYSYSPANASWLQDCRGGCVSTVWTDVVDPLGHAVRSTFSNRFDETEGQLQRTDSYSGAVGSSVLRSEANVYAASTNGAWPSLYGDNLQWRMNLAIVEQVAPLNQRTITQDGNTFTWQAQAFNAFTQVTQTARSNNVGQPTLTEQTSYLNDLPHWVLGLPTQTKNITSNEVVDQYIYNLANVTLSSRARFGQPLMSYTFNSAGQLASFTDGKGRTTSLSNYYRGIPQTIGYPDTTHETLVVDDFGQISSLTDQAGHTTNYSYDPIGRISGISYPTGDEMAWAPEAFTYTFVTSAERGLPANHWKRTTTTGSANAVTYFDAMLRPVLSDSAIGSTVQASTAVTYDSKGQKVFASYPSATAQTFTLTPASPGSHTTYDALGRAIQVQQTSELGTLTSSTAYLSGARQQVTDPKGNVTTTRFQVFDEPSYNAVIQVQAPAGITQTIARDIYGNPLSITQSGLYGTESDSVTKTLIYDSYHRVCRTTEPESGSEIVHYDAANNLDWSASGLTISPTDITCAQGQVATAAQTARTYDAMNRVTTIQPPSGTQSTSYGYDAVGRLTSAVSGISNWSGTYNYRGMLTGESLQLVGQNAWGIGYAHDANGSLSLIHYPDGENVSYAPDALGRPTQAGSYASGISYFPNGQVAQFTYGNGTSYVAEQNARQLLSNFSYGSGSTVQLSEDLAYDANGNISTVSDLAGGPRNKSFGYDALNRLTSATAAGLWGTQAFTYDAINNLRTLQTGAQLSTYAYDISNKLTSISSGGSTVASYLYDTRGNVIGKNGTTLVYDQKNQLTQIAGSGAYAYDASGRRVSKTAGGVTTYYFYSQAGQLMYQWAPSLAQSTDFIYLGSKMIGDNESVVLGAPATIGFDANPNNGSYTVSWGAVAGASSYLLQERANGGAWTTVYSGSASSTTLSARAGGSYVYQVEGCIGATCGAFTSSATLGVRPAVPTVSVPTGTINGTFTVSWTAPVSTTGYTVQESFNGGAWNTIASNTTATSISRPGTTSGSYTYQVAAANGYGNRGWAASRAVTVDITYGVLPTTPAALSVPASSNNGNASVSWSAATLATRYVVQQSSNGGTSWAGIYNGAGTSTAVSGLTDGSYLFQVQACNTYGCSGWKAGSATLVVTTPPTTAPTVSAPASSSNGSYTVSWSGVSGSVSYTLQEQINGGGWSTVQTNALTSWSTSGRGNGTYGYRVQACNVGGCGPWSATGTTTVLLPPAAPTSISVPATSSGSIAVSWAASATTTTYGLDQSVNGGAWAQVYANSATSTSLTVSVSGSYSYRASACNASGCNGDAVSSAVVVTIPPGSAPSISVPASSGTGSFSVSWGGVSGATSYTLQESVNGGGWSTVQASGAISWGTNGRGNGSYGYRVQACNVGGCGPWSATGTTTVLLPPAAPTSISVPATSSGTIAISWAASATTTTYALDQSVNGGAWVQVYANSATSTSLNVGVSGTYSYRASACNASGCNGYAVSSAVGVTIPPGSPPSISVPASSSTGSFSVSWGSVSGATSYTLQESVNGGGWSTVQASGAISWGTSGRGNGSYGYRVQACNSGGCGAWSATGTTAVALVPASPSAPTLNVTGPSSKPVVTANWAGVAGATSYVVEETDPDGTISTFYSGPNTTARMLIFQTGSVKFRTQACNTAGCSTFSGYSFVTLHSGNANLLKQQPVSASSVQGGVQ